MSCRRAVVDRAPLSSYRLPRGRHGIPPEVVVENQRWRLLAAVAEVLGEKGYARIRSGDVAARASVSRATFYEHFDNVGHCLLVAYELAADCVVELAADACRSGDNWRDRVALAIETILEFLSAEPAFARLLGMEAPAGVASIAAARRRFIARMAALLRKARASAAPTAHEGPGPEARLVEGALGLVSNRLGAGQADRLPELAAGMAELLVGRLALSS